MKTNLSLLALVGAASLLSVACGGSDTTAPVAGAGAAAGGTATGATTGTATGATATGTATGATATGTATGAATGDTTGTATGAGTATGTATGTAAGFTVDGPASGWEAGYVLTDGTAATFLVMGALFTYNWEGSTCTLVPANGEEVTSEDAVTVSTCTGAAASLGGGIGLNLCSPPADPSFLPAPYNTWDPESKHTFAECNPGKTLKGVTIPGLTCGKVEFNGADGMATTNLNEAVSVHLNVAMDSMCNLEAFDLKWAFDVE